MSFEAVIRAGGIAVFPADTVYGLACDPEHEGAVGRLYALKGRPPDKPAAVMFFALDQALAAFPEWGPRTRAAAEALLPGPVTLVLPNPRQRFPLACRPTPETVGLRVPDLPHLAGVNVAVLQSSANHSGGGDARRLEEVPEDIRAAADLVLDGGTLPGVPSTVVDLRTFEHDGRFGVLREGALERSAVARAVEAIA